MKKVIFLLIITLLAAHLSSGQSKKTQNDWLKNWVVGSSGGVSYLAMELKKDLTQASMDMNSLPDLTYSFHIYKRLSKKFDLGLEYRKAFFNGYKKFSENANWLMYSTRFNNELVDFKPYPIYYNTSTSFFAVDGKLNFLNLYSKRYNFLNMNFYLRGELGISYVGVEMGYRDRASYEGTGLDHPIYEKGQGKHPQKDSYLAYSLGFGFHHQFSPRWSYFSEFSLFFVSNDYLDGIHNYNLVTQAGGTQTLQRVGVYDTIGILRFGFNYQFDLAKAKKKEGTNPTQWTTKKKGYQNEYYLNKKNIKQKGSDLPFVR
jgi:hypothetical protein